MISSRESESSADDVREFYRVLRVSVIAAFAVLLLISMFGCATTKPQQGGTSTTTLGGANAPTIVTNKAPENPQTPSTTTVEKTTTREFAPTISEAQPAAAAHTVKTNPVPDRKDGSAPTAPALPNPSNAPLVREIVTERATTTTGSAQKDTVRDLGARLANMRGVLWVGVLLMIGGPLVGWKLGWFTNGCIAGAVGLLLVILSTVIPGHEAWFGLGGLLLIPLVAFVYYRAHHDANNPSNPKS